MFTRQRAWFTLIPFFLLLLAACTPSPAVVPAVASSEPKQMTPEAIASATTQPEPAPASVDAIAAGNLTRLAASSLSLPAYPERILWPAPQTPGIPSEADLLLLSEASLYPVAINPAGSQPLVLLDPVLLPLNGNVLAAVAPDASRLLVQEPGRLALYSPDGRLLREIAELARAGSASFSPDGTALVVTSQEEWAAYVYGADGSIVKLTGFETAAPIYSALLGPQGRTMVWIARGTLQFHDATAVKDGLGARLDFMDFIGPVVFSPDGSRMALGVGAELFLYSIPEGELLAQLPLDAPVNTLAFSPAGDILAGNYRDGFQTWDAHTLEPLVTLPSGGSETLLVSFSPDGRALVTTHNNNELRVWVIE